MISATIEAPLMEIVAATMRCMHRSGMELGDRRDCIRTGTYRAASYAGSEALFGASYVAVVDVYDNRLSKAKRIGRRFCL